MADRTIHAAVVTAHAATHVGKVGGLLVMQLDSGDVRLCSFPFDLSFDWAGTGAVTFLGVGDFGNVGPVEESGEIKPYSLSFELTGVKASYLATALAENVQGRRIRTWEVVCDADHAIVGTPTREFVGWLDTMRVRKGRTGVIRVTAHSRLVRWEDPRLTRYADADHKARWPKSRFFEPMAESSERTIVWGTG